MKRDVGSYFLRVVLICVLFIILAKQQQYAQVIHDMQTNIQMQISELPLEFQCE